jgi:hypothetical protein
MQVKQLQPCGVMQLQPCDVMQLQPYDVRQVKQLQPCGVMQVKQLQPCHVMQVRQLQDDLKSLGLPTTGKFEEIMARLLQGIEDRKDRKRGVDLAVTVVSAKP